MDTNAPPTDQHCLHEMGAFAYADSVISKLAVCSDFNSCMASLNEARLALLGKGQMTVNFNVTPTVAVGEPMWLQRIWTTHPSEHPVGTRKRKNDTLWTRQVLRLGKVFVCEGDDAIAETFADHILVNVLHFHAVVNVPMVQDGICLATLNVATSRTKWTAAEVALIRLFAVIARPWVMQERPKVLRETGAPDDVL